MSIALCEGLKLRIGDSFVFVFRPDPVISWLKENASLPIGRYQVKNFNTELMLTNLQPSDGGRYHCNAQNPESQNVRESIDVKIEGIFGNGNCCIYLCSAQVKIEGNLAMVTVVFTSFQPTVSNYIKVFKVKVKVNLATITVVFTPFSPQFQTL